MFENTVSPSNASQLTKIWVSQTRAGVFGSVAVVNGTVYVGDFSGNETAYSAATGHQIWRTEMAKSSGNHSFTGCFGGQNNVRGIDATATVWNGMVFAPADNNHLYSVYASNGTTVPGWPVDMSNHTSDNWKAFYPYGSPLVYNGYVYIGTASGCDNPLVEGQILQINITSPSVSHIFTVAPGTGAGGGIWSTPSLEASAKTVWATTGNCPSSTCTPNWTQAIVALNATNVCQPHSGNCTSKGYWHILSGSDVDFGAGATVYYAANGTPMVVATNKNGYAYAFYADTLKANGGSNPAWSLQTSTYGCQCGKNIAPAAFSGNTVFLGSSATKLRNGTICAGGAVRAVYPANGTIKWDQCAPGIVRAGLTHANGLVADAADWTNNHGATVEVRNATNGAVLASISVNQTVNGEPVISDGRLFFGTGNWSTLCGDAPTHPCPPGYVQAFGIPEGARASALQPYGYAANYVTVDGFGNATGGMPTYNFTWNWGDNTVGYGRFPAHTWYGTSLVTVVLTITDAASEVATMAWLVYDNVYLCNNGLSVCATAGLLPCYTYIGCIGVPIYPVSFALAYEHGSGGIGYDWDFGDSSTHSTAARPTHTYSSHNTYTVTVTITDSDHHQASKSFQVKV